MNGLILFVGEYQKFDRESVVRVLSSIKEIYHDNLESARLDPSIDEIEGRYDRDDNSTIVTFQADSVGAGAIWFRGTGPAAIDLAFRIQQEYPEPLRVVHDGYIFDLVISDFDSAADLGEAMDKAANEAVREG